MQDVKSVWKLNRLGVSGQSASNTRVCVSSTMVDAIPLYSPDAVRAKASEVR